MELLIALALAYLVVAPDPITLAATRGAAGAVRGGLTGESPARSRRPSGTPRGGVSRPVAVLDGWRDGIAAARKARAEGRDVWSRSVRASRRTARFGGRVAGGAGNLAGGIRATIRDRHAKRAAQLEHDLVDVGQVDTAGTAGTEAPSAPETPDSSPVSGAGGRTDLRFGDDDSDPTGVKDCNTCGGGVKNAEPCPSCLALQRLWSAHWDSLERHLEAQDVQDGLRSGRRYDGENPVRRQLHAVPSDQAATAAVTSETPDGRPAGPVASNITTPKGIGLMALAGTELSNIDDVDGEIDAAVTAMEQLSEVFAELRQWGANLPDRWSSTDWGTRGLDESIVGVADSVSGAIDPDSVLEQLSHVREQVEEARRVGEVAAAAQAQGNLRGFGAA